MGEIEYIFIDKDLFDGKNFDHCLFKNIEKITHFYICDTGNEFYTYLKKTNDSFSLYEVVNIPIPKNKILIVGYLD